MLRRITVPPMDLLAPALARPAAGDPALRQEVERVVADVRARGDAAVIEHARRLDGARLATAAWEVPREGWAEAFERLPPLLQGALAEATRRVRDYHDRHHDEGYRYTLLDGSQLGMRVSPIERVGLYVAGGASTYPSSVIMSAIPAKVAGVREVVAVTPEGSVTDAVLAACLLAGVDHLYQVGGAPAIAALAAGTATIPRVDKIVGTGDRWVREAKRQVAGEVGIDMVGGPTEVLIIADATADVTHVAADLVAQAEHGPEAVAWCVTPSPALADQLPAALEAALARGGHPDTVRATLAAHGVLVVVPDLETACRVSDLRAPEHLELLVADAERWADRIRHAGAIYVGDASPQPVGDYYAGPSHVIPTGGAARFASPLGLHDFLKRTSVVRYSRAALERDGPAIAAFAEAEGLKGHADAIRIRLR
ncbi:MAG TPA: histidinol dehydrogenase [Gemmatimonadales bacterium]|nr:histidinol dehydrogenase [Gemmatimonadales bacterium]